jgi:hypothetical protein
VANWHAIILINDYSMANEYYYHDKTFERLGYHQNSIANLIFDFKAGSSILRVSEKERKGSQRSSLSIRKHSERRY